MRLLAFLLSVLLWPLAYAGDVEKEHLASQLYDATMAKQVAAVVRITTNSMLRRNPDSKRQVEIYRQWASESVGSNEYKKIYTDFYIENFSEAELKELVGFTGRPAFIDYTLKWQNFPQWSAPRFRAFLQSKSPELIRRLRAAGFDPNKPDNNQQLRELLATTQQAIEVDKTQFENLSKALDTSSREIIGLRKELALYRDILSPPDGRSGLRVHSLEIQPSDRNDHYSYKLTMVQSIKHEATIHGTALLQIVGTRNGQQTVYKLPTSNGQPIKIQLRYFQEISGQFELPRGFKPNSVRVSIIGQGGSGAVEQTFDWPQI